jgi:hypothetical protein
VEVYAGAHAAAADALGRQHAAVRSMMRLARPDDWPTIALWRAAHHARMEQRNGIASCAGVQLGDAVWVVAEDDGSLLAACSFFDNPPVRTFFDLYWSPGHAGKRAAYELAGTVIRFGETLGLEARGNTNISNWEYSALLRGAGFEIYAVDDALDVCYFRKERKEGFRYVGKFQKRHADQRQPSRPSETAAADPGATYHGAAGQ